MGGSSDQALCPILRRPGPSRGNGRLFLFDITERKRAEQEILDKNRLEAAIDVAELGFYQYAEGFRVVAFDARARDTLGLEETDQPRKVWAERVHAEIARGSWRSRSEWRTERVIVRRASIGTSTHSGAPFGFGIPCESWPVMPKGSDFSDWCRAGHHPQQTV